MTDTLMCQLLMQQRPIKTCFWCAKLKLLPSICNVVKWKLLHNVTKPLPDTMLYDKLIVLFNKIEILAYDPQIYYGPLICFQTGWKISSR